MLWYLKYNTLFLSRYLHFLQRKPLSRGEILGCTSPQIDQVDLILFVADGRFHIEVFRYSILLMIVELFDLQSNYSLFEIQSLWVCSRIETIINSQVLTHEQYDYDKMMSIRRKFVLQASKAKKWGIVLGTLGRQVCLLLCCDWIGQFWFDETIGRNLEETAKGIYFITCFRDHFSKGMFYCYSFHS